MEIPVTDTKVMAPESYEQASAAAAGHRSPIEIALKVVGDFEGQSQHIVQVNEGSEAPWASRVTVVQDGLLDDSIRARRWDIALQRSAAGTWVIREVRLAWRCRRGDRPDQFAATPCP